MPATKRTPKNTRVFLIDDHPAIRSAVRDTVEVENDLSVCGEVPTADEAFRQIEDRGPDVAIVDSGRA